jgi:outer membrane lipoprotein-sorting protein
LPKIVDFVGKNRRNINEKKVADVRNLNFAEIDSKLHGDHEETKIRLWSSKKSGFPLQATVRDTESKVSALVLSKIKSTSNVEFG